MKNQKEKAKLSFIKTNIIELNDEQINEINGGSTDLVSIIIKATTYGTWLMVV